MCSTRRPWVSDPHYWATRLEADMCAEVRLPAEMTVWI